MEILKIVVYLQIFVALFTLLVLLHGVIESYISSRNSAYCFSNWKRYFTERFIYIIAYDFVFILMIIFIGIF